MVPRRQCCEVQYDIVCGRSEKVHVRQQEGRNLRDASSFRAANDCADNGVFAPSVARNVASAARRIAGR
ncbi:hypothetical protein EMIT0111MI5_170044 [Burkholderia sp. IT-111MI5]